MKCKALAVQSILEMTEKQVTLLECTDRTSGSKSVLEVAHNFGALLKFRVFPRALCPARCSDAAGLVV